MAENKIIFSKDVAPVILQILKDNSLYETTDQFNDKLKREVPLNGGIVRSAIDQVVSSGYSRNNLTSLLQQNLLIDAGRASKIASAIEIQIIPFAQKPKIEQTTQIKKEPASEERVAAPQTPMHQHIEESPAKEKFVIEKNPAVTQRPRTGPDNYREPIE